ANINEVVRMTHSLMDQRVQARAERAVESNKGKWENFQGAHRESMPKEEQLAYWKCSWSSLCNEGWRSVARLECGYGTLINNTPVKLDTSYEVELADGKIVSTNTILRVIVCGEKIVRIPYNNKTLIIEGDRGASQLRIISCIKAQKYIERGCQLYIAQVTNKEPVEKRVEDVHVIRDFPKNKEEHREHLRIILELLKKEQLYAKFSKCDFWLESVQFYDHVIDSKGIHVDPAKIEAIKN
ncbi:hypothetical protein Tco_1433378, partial [Tanacetum coccineum]